MNIPVKKAKWKFIFIAIFTAIIIFIFLLLIIIWVFREATKINDFDNWMAPLVITFIVLTGIDYAFLLFLVIHKRNSKNEKDKPPGLKKSISIPVVSINRSIYNAKPSGSYIPDLEKLIKLKKTGIISEEQFRQLKAKL